jgi:hypothetical protein
MCNEALSDARICPYSPQHFASIVLRLLIASGENSAEQGVPPNGTLPLLLFAHPRITT